MIQPLKQALNESIKTIDLYQRGELLQVKTNREWLDHTGGVLPKNIISIVAASFGGKSTELENLKEDIMNVDINPKADNFVWLSNAFEMSNFATTLRDIKKQTKKSFKDILSQPFSEDEKSVLQTHFDKRRDGRFFVNQIPLTAKQFIIDVDNFLTQHKDKDFVVLDLDHIGLVKASSDNKKLAVDDVVEGLNELKNKYDNFLVILLCQLNRNILSRIKDKSNEAKIRRDDIYQSDTVFHISDYVYGLQNAYYLGIEEYRKIKPNKYPYLSHRFTDEDSKGKVSLIAEGCIFVEILKDRTADLDFPDLYTIEIKPIEREEKTNLSSAPVFENEQIPEPNFDMTQAFDAPEEDEPF